MSTVKFSATKLSNNGKKGTLKSDPDGYFELVIGGLNTHNSVGEYYTLDGAKELFEQSSTFMRRVNNGCLKGEVGHPKKAPGMSDNDYIRRILSIEETNVCCHFKEIWLDTEFGRKNPKFNNANLVAIMAKVKPAGPKADALQRALTNPDENVCFSIRALTQDYYQRGQTYRVLQNIICFDYVTEPGIAISNKWDSPSLESLQEMFVTRSQIEQIVANKDLIAVESKQLAHEILNTSFQTKSFTLPIISKW